MKITHAQEAPTVNNPHGVAVRPIYDSEHAMAVHITLEPGESLKRHATPVDVFFYILEGQGQVEIGDELQDVARDDIIESPARIPHRLLNPSQARFRVLVVKVPKPTTSTKVL